MKRRVLGKTTPFHALKKKKEKKKRKKRKGGAGPGDASPSTVHLLLH
jgi:hypothetical protein